MQHLLSHHHSVFCPKCGEEMTLVPTGLGDVFKCVAGDMELSKALHDALSEVFVARSRRGKTTPFKWSGGRWFCPACGKPMRRDTEHVQCETCGEYLDEFIYRLVEIHPHLTRLMLTVEETFEIRGRGLVLAPFLPASEARPKPIVVELHKPDGAVTYAVKALVQVPFIHPTPKVHQAHVTLTDVAKTDAPIGTKVWVR
jgi:hypothetical protein